MLDKKKEKLRAKKFRGSWGDIKPVTKIIPNKKGKKEKHNKRLFEDAYCAYFI